MDTDITYHLRRATHDSPCRVIRFAHRRRHMQALEKILPVTRRVLLDHGAGDGFSIAQALTHDTPWLGKQISPKQQHAASLHRSKAISR